MRDDLLDIFGPNRHYFSWRVQGLIKDGRFSFRQDRAFAKVGSAENFQHDVALISRQHSVSNKRLRYVMVTLHAPNNTAGKKLFNEAAIELISALKQTTGSAQYSESSLSSVSEAKTTRAGIPISL